MNTLPSSSLSTYTTFTLSLSFLGSRFSSHPSSLFSSYSLSLPFYIPFYFSPRLPSSMHLSPSTHPSIHTCFLCRIVSLTLLFPPFHLLSLLPTSSPLHLPNQPPTLHAWLVVCHCPSRNMTWHNTGSILCKETSRIKQWSIIKTTTAASTPYQSIKRCSLVRSTWRTI